MLGGGKRVSHMNSCAAKPGSFISLAAIIFFLCYLDETRKFLPFGSKEIPAGNENKGILMAKCVRKLSFHSGKSPPVGRVGDPGKYLSLEDRKLPPETGTREHGWQSLSGSQVRSREKSRRLETRKSLPEMKAKEYILQSVSESQIWG
jgi:hypothetical protein